MGERKNHQGEIERNLEVWRRKPLLREIYRGFHRRVAALIDRSIPGSIVEIGSGIGSLKADLPDVITTDLLPNPWLDRVCDAYELPFTSGSVSHLILIDVFHHLEFPQAFFAEAHRVVARGGRIIILDPYISLTSWPVYALFHHEPVGVRLISLASPAPGERGFYAAQGNATRLFFRKELGDWPAGWRKAHAEAFACFHYFLSGGFSRPALYPSSWLGGLQRLDSVLARWPGLFAGRCLISLAREN